MCGAKCDPEVRIGCPKVRDRSGLVLSVAPIASHIPDEQHFFGLASPNGMRGSDQMTKRGYACGLSGA